MSFLYKPDDGVAADFIPFFWNGRYHLFYLKDYRDEAGHGKGTPWFHLVTDDFVNFEDWGEALPRGAEDSQDLWVFTGSAYEKDGTFYIFYTGHNGLFTGTGKPVQAVMRATSPDLRTWTKDESFLFFAPEGYEPDDWRDPFIYWNDDTHEYGMLLAARKPTGPSRNRGCVALATSKDLNTWEVQAPFWSPDLYFTHECPDLFQIGDWWYLVYSTFSERSVTHYRMSRSINGPWIAPPNDTFDSRAFYAAKTASDGERRYIFGWLPTRVGEKDDGNWQWGGHLVTHEITQESDGTLTVRPPASVLAPFSNTLPLAPKKILGDWKTGDNKFSSASTSRFSALSLGDLPQTCLIETEISLSPGTVNAGLFFRADSTLDHYYQLRIEPGNHRIVFDRWPRPGDQPFVLERPLEVSDTVRLKIIVDETCIVAYVNDQIALSCRMYEHLAGEWGLFVTEGAALFANVSLRDNE